MKTLLIVRHAEAEPKKGPSPDIERPLSEKGEHDAAKVAQRLQNLGSIPDRCISSPAERARATARIMAGEWGWDEAELGEEGVLYPGDPEEILLWLPELPNDADRIMIIGHQPVLSQLVDLLTGRTLAAFPPASVVCCEFEVDDQRAVTRDSGILKWTLDPGEI